MGTDNKETKKETKEEIGVKKNVFEQIVEAVRSGGVSVMVEKKTPKKDDGERGA